MNYVVACESRYKPLAVGDNGTSFGLVQIHLPAHPSTTRKQAENAEYALNFLAAGLKSGQGSMWTCYNQMGVD